MILDSKGYCLSSSCTLQNEKNIFTIFITIRVLVSTIEFKTEYQENTESNLKTGQRLLAIRDFSKSHMETSLYTYEWNLNELTIQWGRQRLKYISYVTNSNLNYWE